jgi:hypothetical protein
LSASAVVFAIPALASAGNGVFFFNDRNAFEAAAAGAGKFMKGIEDFEESSLPAGQIVGVDDPLDATTDNDWFNPGDIEFNLRIQSNTGGANSSVLSPHGASGLALQSAGFAGAVSDNVVANFFVDALDLIFLTQDKTAVGFNTILFAGASTSIRIDVYNTGNALIGSTVVAGNAAGTDFLGAQASAGQFIGRINIFDLAGGAEGADNIEMWTAVPEPASIVAIGFGLALILGLRRRE